MVNASTPTEHVTNFKYYDFAMAAFVAILICSNLIGAAKLATVFGVTFGAGLLFFPLSYVLGDIVTEVYGYKGARRIVWAGFGACVFMSIMSWVVVAMPPAAGWAGQDAYQFVFGQTPRIVAASILAFWAGEMTNAYVMAKMKLRSNGRHLWQRTIGSTVVGQAVDSAIFYPLAFLGVWETHQVLTVMVVNYVLKVAWEVLLTPVTYKVVAAIKKAEGVEVFDAQTNFTPFSVQK